MQPDPDQGLDEPVWLQLELAWPLSLLCGFAGTWLGLLAHVPGLPVALALVAFAPLHLPLSGRAQRARAVGCTLGWLVGIGAAVVGSALDGDLAMAALPGAESWAAHVRERGAGVALSSPERLGAWIVLPGLAVGLAVLAGRRTWGFLGLTGAAWATSALSAGVGLRVAEAAARGVAVPEALAAAFPPDFALDLTALAVAGAALARPFPPAGVGRWSEARAWIALAVGLELAALLARLALAGAWGAWSAERLGSG